MKRAISFILALIMTLGVFLCTVPAAFAAYPYSPYFSLENCDRSMCNFSVKKIDTNSVTLSWLPYEYALSYNLFMYNASTKKYESIAVLDDKEASEYTVKNLKPGTEYKFASTVTFNYYNSDYDDTEPLTATSPEKYLSVITSAEASKTKKINDKIKNGYNAKIISKEFEIQGKIFTSYDTETLTYVPESDYPQLLIECSHGDHAAVSELSHFFDYKGLYTIAYVNKGYLYLDLFGTDLTKKETKKIKMKYELFGDIVTDTEGNYYIVWGKPDNEYKYGVDTMAVSKYDYNAKHIKTTKFYTEENDTWETELPFDAGNCSTIITSDGVLVSSYAREMYNGHQSNDIIAVNISDMSKNYHYGNYVSHSFDQRVIELGNKEICYVNQGDAYPRAFDVKFQNPNDIECDTEKTGSEAFHFFGNLGANYTNSWLGGVAEVSGNVYLVAASAKSMTEKGLDENRNLFVKLVGADREISGSVTRKGTCGGEACTDKGVKWLTSYGSKYTVANPQVVSDSRTQTLVVLWEKHNYKDDKFIESYYTVLSADGTVIQKTTPMNKIRLTSFEDPIYNDGYVYWTTSNGEYCDHVIEIAPYSYYCGYALKGGSTVQIHKLKLGELVYKVPAANVTLSKEAYTYDGKEKKPAVTVKAPDGSKLDPKNYTVKYSSNKNIGKATVTVKFKGEYSGTVKKTFKINPKGTSLSKLEALSKGFKVTWKKQATKTTGYQIQYSTSKNFDSGKTKTVTVSSPKTVSKKITGLKQSQKYYVRVRTYKTVDKTKYYSSWSKAMNIKTKK